MVAERWCSLVFLLNLAMASEAELRSQAVTMQGLGVPIADSEDEDQPNGAMGQPTAQPQNGTMGQPQQTQQPENAQQGISILEQMRL